MRYIYIFSSWFTHLLAIYIYITYINNIYTQNRQKERKRYTDTQKEREREKERERDSPSGGLDSGLHPSFRPRLWLE